MTLCNTIDELCAYLDERGYKYTRHGNEVRVRGFVNLASLTTLPAGVSLSAGGALNLYSLTALPEGVRLTAGKWLDLDGLTALPAGVSLTAGGGLDLGGLTALPEGISLAAGRGLDLRNLTALPEDVSLSASVWLNLSNLDSEIQSYKGVTIRLRMIDGYCMRLISSREIGEVTLWSAQYFRGHLETDPRCYVAQQGETYAHGETAERALRDLRFKLAQADFDCDDLVETIKQRGTVTFNDYRLITGACEMGLRQGLRERGIDPETDELPLDHVLDLCRDGYGGERFRSLFAE